MPNTWVVRTDHSHLQDVILPSLEKGILRQGWGYREDQNLEIIGPLVESGGRGSLNDEQKATWRRVQHWWPGHWDPVREGDLILLPKVPEWGRWCLVEVTGEYRFDRHSESHDHGHMLPVRIVVREIAPSNLAVSASLQRTMRSQSPMWTINAFRDDIDHIIEAGDEARTAHEPSDRLNRILRETREGLLPRIRRDFQGNQLEVPVLRVLEQAYPPPAKVLKRAGRGEHGADFEILEIDPMGIERRTVVQLKDHSEILNDLHALEQIREAFDHYRPVSAAVVLCTAEREGDEFAAQRDALSEELGIPVEAVLGETLAELFLAHLDELTAD